MKRFLVLILASDTAPEYIEFQALWRSWMHAQPASLCDFYFVKGWTDANAAPSEPVFDEASNTLWVDVQEQYGLIPLKMQRAFQAAAARSANYEWVARPNLSSFVDWQCAAAFFARAPPACYGTLGNHGGITYPSGCGFWFPARHLPDVAKHYQHNPNAWQWDDVLMGVVCRKIHVPLRPLPRIDVDGPAQEEAAVREAMHLGGSDDLLHDGRGAFHWRLANKGDRGRDVRMWRLLAMAVNPKFKATAPDAMWKAAMWKPAQAPEPAPAAAPLLTLLTRPQPRQRQPHQGLSHLYMMV